MGTESSHHIIMCGSAINSVKMKKTLIILPIQNGCRHDVAAFVYGDVQSGIKQIKAMKGIAIITANFGSQ